MLGNVCDSVLPVSHIGSLIGSENVYSRIVLKLQAYNRLFIYAGHTNTRINTPWLSSRRKQGGIAVKKTFILRPDGTKMKKGLSWPHIRYTRIKLGFTVTALFSGTPWHVGQGTIHHLQINVPKKGATQQKGCAATQIGECPSSDGEENILGSMTLFHTVILVLSLLDPVKRMLPLCS